MERRTRKTTRIASVYKTYIIYIYCRSYRLRLRCVKCLFGWLVDISRFPNFCTQLSNDTVVHPTVVPRNVVSAACKPWFSLWVKSFMKLRYVR